MTDNAASREARAQEVNRVANLLIATWNRVDPKSGVAMHPASYIATFADLARAVVDDRAEQIIAALQAEQDRLDVESGDYLMDTADCINLIREKFLAAALADEAASQPREGDGGDIALTRATRFTAYDRADPLAIRFEFATDADRVECADELDLILSDAFVAARARMADALAAAMLARGGKLIAVRRALHDTAPADQAQRGEVERLREALQEIILIALDEPYKVVEGQKPCKHTAALNEIYAVADAAIAQSGDPS